MKNAHANTIDFREKQMKRALLKKGEVLVNYKQDRLIHTKELGALIRYHL